MSTSVTAGEQAWPVRVWTRHLFTRQLDWVGWALAPLAVILVTGSGLGALGAFVATIALQLGSSRSHPCTAVIEGDTLRLSGHGVARELLRDEVKLAVVDPDGALTLETAWRVIRLTPEAEDIAARASVSAAMLASLRLEPARRVMRFSDPWPLPRALLLLILAPVLAMLVTMIPAALVAIVAGMELAGVVGCVIWPLATLLIYVYYWLDTVTLGADGIRVRGLLKDRFRPWSDLTDVTFDIGVLQLHPKRGRQFSGTALAERPQQQAALMAVARAHIEEARALRAAAELTAALPRNGRDIAAWRAACENLPRGGAYRATVSSAALDGILQNPAAPPDVRVGAAFALRALHAEDLPARVRIAAEAVADPFAQEALLAAADAPGDDADRRVEKALDTHGRLRG